MENEMEGTREAYEKKQACVEKTRQGPKKEKEFKYSTEKDKEQWRRWRKEGDRR